MPPNTKPTLKLRQIQHFLQDMDDFQYGQKQKFNLQQHLTPADIAAQLMMYIHQHENIQQMIVADIGIGTGMLICGLIYIGAEHAIGFQFDQKYLNKAKQLLEEKVQGASFQLINADIRYINCKQKYVDLVVMNPPFGTKQAHIDMVFMQFAMKISKGNIYSMHKSSTRNYIKKFCFQRGYNMEVIRTVNFPLKKRFKKYHKKDLAFTQVDIILVKPIVKEEQTKQSKQQKQSKQKQQINSKQQVQQKQKMKQKQNKQQQIQRKV